MRVLLCAAALLGACLVLPASTASAGSGCPGGDVLVPCVALCRVEEFRHQGTAARCLRLVGASTAVPAPGSPDDLQGKIIVKLRNFVGDPIPGSPVVLDFNFPGTPCVDTRLCLTPVPGQTLTCSGDVKQISGTTDAFGNVTFTVLGASYNTGSNYMTGHVGPSAPTACVKVRASGEDLTTLRVAILDQNGSLAGQGGVNGADPGIIQTGVVAVIAGQPYLPRLDVNCDGAINGGDVSYELARVIEALSGGGSGAGCPDGAPVGYCPL